MDNQETKVTETTEKEFPIFRILYRNLLLIIIVTVIGLLAGLGVAAVLAKPSYTATKKVMFVAKYSDSASSAGNDMVLAKIYLPNTVEKLKSPLFIGTANELYKGEGQIKAGAIGYEYGAESLIFSLSYTDANKDLVEQKLQAVIDSAKVNLQNPNITVAKDATLKVVENRASVVTNSNFETYIILGGLIGLVGVVLFVLLRNALDTTMRDKEEIERITGSSLIACIEDAEMVDKRREKRNKNTKGE